MEEGDWSPSIAKLVEQISDTTPFSCSTPATTGNPLIGPKPLHPLLELPLGCMLGCNGWREQCEATHRIRERYGLKAALDYLLDEKLVGFAETADRKAVYACELPCFQAAIWEVFHPFEVSGYLMSLKPVARRRLKALVVVH